MSDPSCKTCPFGERLYTGATNNTVCHLGRFSDEPSHPADWWCSEHPLAPGQRDRIILEILKALISHHGVENSPYKETVSLIHVARSLAHDFVYEPEKGKT